MGAAVNEVTRQLQNRGYMALVINVTDEENTTTAMALALPARVDGILFMANGADTRTLSRLPLKFITSAAGADWP